MYQFVLAGVFNFWAAELSHYKFTSCIYDECVQSDMALRKQRNRKDLICIANIYWVFSYYFSPNCYFLLWNFFPHLAQCISMIYVQTWIFYRHIKQICFKKKKIVFILSVQIAIVWFFLYNVIKTSVHMLTLYPYKYS